MSNVKRQTPYRRRRLRTYQSPLAGGCQWIRPVFDHWDSTIINRLLSQWSWFLWLIRLSQRLSSKRHLDRFSGFCTAHPWKQLAKVKVAGTLSEWFRVKKGFWHGCVLSPDLFNILAEMVMRETLDGFHKGLQIGGRVTKLTTFATLMTSSCCRWLLLRQNYRSWWIA